MPGTERQAIAWTPRKLVARAETISSLPTVHLRLNEVVNDPRSSNRDVANVIAEDPGLTARLLRIANSAFFGYPSKVDTITRAVTVIGTKQLRDLALATSVIEMFDSGSEDVVSMESFWRHSIACAVTARVLATYRREINVEHFFVAGLLHDVGRMVMFKQIPDLCRETMDACAADDLLMYQAERDMLGFDHADVGAVLLEQWQLPPSLVKAIEFHHRPAKVAGTGEYAITAAVVHVADVITNAMVYGSSGERFVPPLEDAAWQQLNLPETVLYATLKQLEHQYEDAVSLILKDAA